MARFTLAILPDGRAVLTTAARLNADEAQNLQQVVRGWHDGRWPVLVIADCETVQVAELDIDVDRLAEAVTA
jgi:hypothetical protein